VTINTTLAIGEGKLFFVESRHPALKRIKDKPHRIARIVARSILVALDAKTVKNFGKKASICMTASSCSI
jgi:hypothetical protein